MLNFTMYLKLGINHSKQEFHIETEKLEHLLPHSVLLVVGGQGTPSVSKR